jgi:acyl-CoA reductase-like NAD-dependent aldehyde dehydrogenase
VERVVIIHSLAHACAALSAAREAGTAVTLASAPAAAGYAGPAWFQAIIERAAAAVPGAGFSAILDCGEEAGTALAALRYGVRRVRFAGDTEAGRRLAEIAAELGAAVERAAASAPLDLLDCPDPAAACRRFLTGAGPGTARCLGH